MSYINLLISFIVHGLHGFIEFHKPIFCLSGDDINNLYTTVSIIVWYANFPNQIHYQSEAALSE